MDHLGAVLGPLLAIAILYHFLGYGLWRGTTSSATPDEMHALRWLFAIAFIPGLIAMIPLIGKVRDLPPQKTKEAKREDPSRKAHMPRKFYYFVGIVTLFALGNSSDLFLVLYGKTKFQLGLLQVIALWVALHVSKIVFSLPGGALSDKLGRRPIIIAGWFIYALVYLGVGIVSQEWVFWLLIIAYGFYYGMTEGAEKALVADFVPREHRGTAYGIYHGAIGLAALPASFVFGVFWAVIGPQLAFGIGAALAAAATVLLTILLSRTKEQQEL